MKAVFFIWIIGTMIVFSLVVTWTAAEDTDRDSVAGLAVLALLWPILVLLGLFIVLLSLIGRLMGRP